MTNAKTIKSQKAQIRKILKFTGNFGKSGAALEAAVELQFSIMNKQASERTAIENMMSEKFVQWVVEYHASQTK